MAVYLVSREPAGREIAHRDESSAGAFLCTKEFADQYSLMHYRRGGEKKGVRRWQNEDGSYTSEGYKHYAEMYGWGKLRADRAEKKAEKYEDKAKKAEAELHKQQARVDKAQVKVDRKRNDKNVQKAQVATNKLHEAQLRFDQYRNKAEKYQNKADRIHEKWDQKQERLDKYLNEDGTLNEKAMAKYTYSNGVQSKMNLAGRLKFGSKFAEEFDKQQLDAAKKRGDTDRAKVNAESDKLIDQDYADRKLAREVEERVENNRYVEGSRAFRENAENERRMQDFDNLSAEDKRKTGDYLIQKMSDYQKTYVDKKDEDLDDLDADVAKHADYEFRNDEQWLAQRMDKDSGNENTGYYKPGSNGEKAHKVLEESYAKSSARTEELIREHKLDRSKVYTDRKEYAKLREVVESDKLWKALNAQDKKNEQDLLGAVLKDLGFSDTPKARDIISWYVFLE